MSIETLLRIDTQTGWLERTEKIISPNYDERPANTLIDLLVIHGISLPHRQYGTPWVEALFTNTLDYSADPSFAPLLGMKVSSHLFIRRKGELIQFVPFTKRAWHAGESQFGARTRCNDFSIGIELEGCDDRPYSSHQYQRLAQVTASIMAAYPAITWDHVVGHSDIAPKRKTDPGPAFDWTRFIIVTKQLLPESA